METSNPFGYNGLPIHRRPRPTLHPLLIQDGYGPVRAKPGRYTLTVEVVVDNDGDAILRAGGQTAILPREFMNARVREGAAEKLAPATPTWRPGDVVVVRYGPLSTPYTYVRGELDWPGDRRPAKTDKQISSSGSTARRTRSSKRAACPSRRPGPRSDDPGAPDRSHGPEARREGLGRGRAGRGVRLRSRGLRRPAEGDDARPRPDRPGSRARGRQHRETSQRSSRYRMGGREGGSPRSGASSRRTASRSASTSIQTSGSTRR